MIDDAHYGYETGFAEVAGYIYGTDVVAVAFKVMAIRRY